MSVNQLREVIDRFVNGRPKTYYYAKPGTTLVRGITEIKSESDIADFITLVYQNGFKIDLYDEHHRYDVMAMVRDDNFPMPDSPLVEDHVSSNEEECVTIPEFVDVQVEGADNVVIKSLSIDDHFLNKLVGNGNFIGTLDDPNPPLEGTYVEEADPKEDIIDMKYKVKSGISYPTFNPTTPWNEQKPILGMKYKNPLQLKQSLANYGVANGFQMCGPSDNEKTPSKGKGKDKANESQPECEPGQCKRAKQCAMYDHEGGLVEHYCLKDGWKAGYRRVIGIDGCFLTHSCKGELLTVMGRDANNQMFPRTWAMSKVASECQDNICPSIRKQLEALKEKQRLWVFSIKLVPSSRMWKRNNNVPPLPPIHRKMYGKPRSKRIRHPTERDHHTKTTKEKGPSKATKGGKGDGSGLSKATKGGKGVGSGHLKATKGCRGVGSVPIEAKKGVQGNRSGPSKEKTGKKGDGSSPSKNDGKEKKVAHKGGINVNEMTPSQDQLFRQDQDALEDLLHEEERRRQMEWENQAPNEGQAPNKVQAPNEGKAPS
ncbi:hypothetical protein Tco_1001923 [Tanacetum coccineum]|uniref:Uncharacterized protein n=1 Tax=Tanacetum coccineum TaxID=301880 RepID=A0ABQ5F558_9ASTR